MVSSPGMRGIAFGHFWNSTGLSRYLGRGREGGHYWLLESRGPESSTSCSACSDKHCIKVIEAIPGWNLCDPHSFYWIRRRDITVCICFYFEIGCCCFYFIVLYLLHNQIILLVCINRLFSKVPRKRWRTFFRVKPALQIPYYHTKEKVFLALVSHVHKALGGLGN